MNTPRKTSLFDNIIAAFAQGLTFGFGHKDILYGDKAAEKNARNR
jgi:hypothetical protein